MEQPLDWFGPFLGLSSLGFYLFLAVWVGMTIWARTKETLFVQQTLRKVVDSGTALTPEVIEALQRRKPKRTTAEIHASATRYRYWGVFLVVVGIVVTLLSLDAERPMGGVIFFSVPGLFCLAHSFIKRRTQLPPQA
jgi:hypothetical protein